MAGNQQGGGSQSGDRKQDQSGMNDPSKTSDEGRKGGQQTHQSNDHGNKQQGGSGNFANDPDKASEAGRKGGQASHNK